jgi:hypothetical protein
MISHRPNMLHDVNYMNYCILDFRDADGEDVSHFDESGEQPLRAHVVRGLAQCAHGAAGAASAAPRIPPTTAATRVLV